MHHVPSKPLKGYLDKIAHTLQRISADHCSVRIMAPAANQIVAMLSVNQFYLHGCFLFQISKLTILLLLPHFKAHTTTNTILAKKNSIAWSIYVYIYIPYLLVLTISKKTDRSQQYQICYKKPLYIYIFLTKMQKFCILWLPTANRTNCRIISFVVKNIIIYVMLANTSPCTVKNVIIL